MIQTISAGHDQADQPQQNRLMPVKVDVAGRELRVHAAEHVGRDRIEHDGREHAGDDEALVERAHDVVAGAEPDEERADDRGDDADAAR